MKKPQPYYTDEFKKQIVQLYKNGKSAKEIMKEFGVTTASVYNWNRQFEKSGLFKAKDNRSQEEHELIALRKENKQLRMENDILKLAAVILGQK